ncbi:uncharacterized protein LOC117591938 [Drosophila guanche]|uniref:Uncharacterized protein n=1 Tax=Drosophila guanche TaxID=7266 RepID=A0A3B0JL03_DROGU|nr:uncharacterized protein LOC117591938 [Drosophila guanche]SPP73916.1 Hypothetical predicted protein [Drosophila guanche]
MMLPLLHRCTKMVLLKKQMRRKGRHLRSYRRLAHRRLRRMRRIREELLQQVRKAIAARQRDMAQVQRDQARHEVARMLAMYKKWLNSWSKSLLSQRRLIGQQQQLEGQLDCRLRLLRKQLGRHRTPQRLLGRCFLKLRKSLKRASHLHPSIGGQAHLWEEEAEEVRRYLSQLHGNRKKPGGRLLEGFSDFWDTEVLRKKRSPIHPLTTEFRKPSVPEMPDKPTKIKKKKHSEPETEFVDIHFNELRGACKPKRLKKKQKKGLKRIQKPTIDELEELYAEQMAIRAGQPSKSKKRVQRKRRSPSRTLARMNRKKLLTLDAVPEDVSLKSKVVARKSAAKNHGTRDNGVKAQENPKQKPKGPKRSRKESRGLPQKTEQLPDIEPNLKATKKTKLKRQVADNPPTMSFFRLEVQDNLTSETNEKGGEETVESIQDQDNKEAERDYEIEKRNSKNFEPTNSEMSMLDTFEMLRRENNSLNVEQKALANAPKKQRVSRKSSGLPGQSLRSITGKRKKSSVAKDTQPVEQFMPGKMRLQRAEEPGSAVTGPRFSDEDSGDKLRYSFHLSDLNSDPKFRGLQHLLKDVIERNSVLDRVIDVQALMSVVGKHNMWNTLASLHSELLATDIQLSDIVELLSKKYLDYLRAIVNAYGNNPTAEGKSMASCKYGISSINVPSEIAENIGWLSEHTTRRMDDGDSQFKGISAADSKHGLYQMAKASGLVNHAQLKKLLDEELKMERNLREERRRKLFSGTSARFPSTSSMSQLEIDPKEEQNLQNVEKRYSMKSIRKMLDTYTQHFKSLAKSPLLLALEKQRSITEAKQSVGQGRSLIKKKNLRSAERLFYAPRQTCRVKNLHDESDDCECDSACSGETLVDSWPHVYGKCPRCGVKVELPSPTPRASALSLSQGSIEACAKNELMLSTVADICIHCGYIHDKCQPCPQLPICPAPLQQLRRIQAAAEANNRRQPPNEQQREVLMCCSPCGILRKSTRYADQPAEASETFCLSAK